MSCFLSVLLCVVLAVLLNGGFPFCNCLMPVQTRVLLGWYGASGFHMWKVAALRLFPPDRLFPLVWSRFLKLWHGFRWERGKWGVAFHGYHGKEMHTLFKDAHTLQKNSKKVYNCMVVEKKWFAGITKRVCSHHLIGLSCPGGKKMRWSKKRFLVLLFLIFVASWSSVCAQVQQKYNPLTNEWETVKPDSTLKYNPFSGRWVYAVPNAVPKHNPMENRWEMVSPDSELRYNFSDGTWSFAPPGVKLQLSPFSGQLVYPHWIRLEANPSPSGG